MRRPVYARAHGFCSRASYLAFLIVTTTDYQDYLINQGALTNKKFRSSNNFSGARSGARSRTPSMVSSRWTCPHRCLSTQRRDLPCGGVATARSAGSSILSAVLYTASPMAVRRGKRPFIYQRRQKSPLGVGEPCYGSITNSASREV